MSYLFFYIIFCEHMKKQKFSIKMDEFQNFWRTRSFLIFGVKRCHKNSNRIKNNKLNISIPLANFTFLYTNVFLLSYIPYKKVLESCEKIDCKILNKIHVFIHCQYKSKLVMPVDIELNNYYLLTNEKCNSASYSNSRTN